MKIASPTALIVWDGFGYSKELEHNAVAQAHMPFFRSLLKSCSWKLLEASGKAVGLPDGFIGNSEVGHMTIGMGAVHRQSITRVSDAIKDSTLCANQELAFCLEKLSKTGKTLHIVGLLSDAGVHALTAHMYVFLECAQQKNIHSIKLHLFLDGRDTIPFSANCFLDKLYIYLEAHPTVQLASVQGRAYGMDRDAQWDKTVKAFNIMTQALPIIKDSLLNQLKAWYAKGNTEEFFPPVALDPYGFIQPGDGVIIFNTRPDRIRQFVSLLLKDNADLATHAPDLAFLITPVQIGQDYPTTVLFPQESYGESLIDKLDRQGYSTFTIAESTKYAHVTYFFNGTREAIHEHETRVLIPSYSPEKIYEYPCMKAPQITKSVLEQVKKDAYDFYLINYANADMIGHTGNFKATVQALECLDRELEKLYDIFVQKNEEQFF